jgi:hypothetical protein
MRHDAARQGKALISGVTMRKSKAAMTAAAVAIAAALTLPATASAASVTITGDDGNPLALNPAAPPTLRQMKTDVGVTRTGTEQRYLVSATGPAGPAMAPSCYSIPTTNRMDFQGNGTYTITVTTYTTNNACTGAGKTTNYPVVLNPTVGLGQPAGALLTRKPNELISIDHFIPITLNPGALTQEIRYAKGGVLAPDGSISGPSQPEFVDPAAGAVKLTLTEPGDYVMVAREQAFSQAFTPWSAPIRFRAVAPFDFAIGSPSFPDSRGPRYKMRVQLREKTARGKVRIKVARGKRGGKFRSIGKARINRKGVLKKKFTLGSPGNYRARFIFKGSATTAPGTVTAGFRVTRRFF